MSRVVCIGTLVFMVGAVAAAACGSDDSKRTTRGNDGGGQAGERTSAGEPGTPDGGEPPQGGGGIPGTSGSPGVGEAGEGAAAGAAGQPNEPNPLDRYADPAGGVDTNDGTSTQLAFRTIQHALTEMQSGGTLWILDGSVGGGSTEPTGPLLQVPDGVHVRAVNDGAVTFGEGMGGMNPPGFVFLGSGGLRGIHFDGVPVAVRASSGDIELEALTFANAGGGCSDGDAAAVVLTGTAKATLTAGSVTEYAGVGSNIRNMVQLRDTAELSIAGGSFTGLAASSCSPHSHFVLLNASKLSLDGVSIIDTATAFRGGVIGLLSGTCELNMTGSTLDGGTATPGIYIDNGGSPKVNLTDSTLTGFLTDAAIMLGYENGTLTPEITLDNVTISDNRYGFVSTSPYGAAVPVITATNLQLLDNWVAGMLLFYGGSIDLSGGEISGNGFQADNNPSAYGGILFDQPGATFHVKLRGVSVIDNPNPAGQTTAAIRLMGTAASTYDLGKVGDPGNNDFRGNGRTALLLDNASVTAYAVGNTWNPSVQTASGAGKYAAPAGDQLSVTTGTGTNYIVTTGTLVLAESP